MRICLFCLTLLPLIGNGALRAAPPDPPASPAALRDALGRDTPRGTIIGFLRSAQKDNYRAAARFLQVSDSERATTGVRLAVELRAVMDQGFETNLDSISARPEGTLDDGLRPDQELAGHIQLNDAALDVVLVRVADPQSGQIWLVSSDTLKKVPAVHRELGLSWIEDRLPSWLVERRLLSMPLWLWGATIMLALLLVALPTWLARNSSVGGPLTLVAGMLAHLGAVDALGVPVLYRYYYNRVVVVTIIMAAGWLLLRLIDRLASKALARSQATGLAGRSSLLMLGSRVVKVLLGTWILLAALSAFGFDTKTLLAGLGIGGIAIALAAQKTIENFFGGVSVLTDQVFRVGDACRFGDLSGTVEDVGLRSTRIRTAENSTLSIPNGVIATMNIENLSSRTRILLSQTLLFQVDTPSEALDALLEQLRQLLGNHPSMHPTFSRARLLALEDAGIRVELFGYLKTANGDEAPQFREEVLLDVIRTVEASGLKLAAPALAASAWKGASREKL